MKLSEKILNKAKNEISEDKMIFKMAYDAYMTLNKFRSKIERISKKSNDKWDKKATDKILELIDSVEDEMSGLLISNDPNMKENKKSQIDYYVEKAFMKGAWKMEDAELKAWLEVPQLSKKEQEKAFKEIRKTTKMR